MDKMQPVEILREAIHSLIRSELALFTSDSPLHTLAAQNHRDFMSHIAHLPTKLRKVVAREVASEYGL